jgi:hypothetical protein
MSGTLPVDSVPNQSLQSLDYESLLWRSLVVFTNAIQTLFCKFFRISKNAFQNDAVLFLFLCLLLITLAMPDSSRYCLPVVDMAYRQLS